jgi:outer membrane lipoprotein SlyB
MKRLPGSIGIVLLIAAAVAAGCKENASESSKAMASQQAQKPRYATLTIPAGTNVIASLGTTLSTDANHSGDAFVATTTEPIIIDGKTVVPAGARMRGTLSDVQASGRISGRARMTLGFDEITDSAGKTHAISAQPLTMQAASKTQGDVEKIAAGGVIGAVIGGLTGGGKGAAIGAGAGAGAGTVLMLATKGDDVQLNPGQRLNVQIRTPLSIQTVAQR